MDLSRKYRVTGVPKTIVNETIEILGGLPEQDFVRAALDCRRRTRLPAVRLATLLNSAQSASQRERPNSRQVPSLPFTRSTTSILPSASKPIRRFALFGFRRAPLRHQRITVAPGVQRPEHAGVVEPHPAVTAAGNGPIVRVAFEDVDLRRGPHLVPERQLQELPVQLPRPLHFDLRGLIQHRSSAGPRSREARQQRVSAALSSSRATRASKSNRCMGPPHH